MLPPSSRLGLVLFLLPLVALPGCNSLESSDAGRSPEGPLLPLAVGNEWHFRGQDAATAGTTRIVDSIRIGGHTFYVAEGSVLSDTLRTDDRGRIYRIQNGTEQLWLDPTVADGESYVVETHVFQGETYERLVTVNHDVRVETPAATFSNGIEFRIDVPQMADEEQWITLAPGVGPIRWRTAWVGPFRLVSFHPPSP